MVDLLDYFEQLQYVLNTDEEVWVSVTISVQCIHLHGVNRLVLAEFTIKPGGKVMLGRANEPGDDWYYQFKLLTERKVCPPEEAD
ncbi:hypothetical protein LX66_1867 [Chitinophaga japonensis]|uniref:Uncharacterized protein n=1 Tax=Chitinophaga japonensis TaxID=104662 RepID=A0A562T408_CHIJA|nr:hypothetical protein LX66_1867 [Chitinophaga japonensis]